MTTGERNRAIYAVAEEFLHGMAPEGVDLEKYYVPKQPETLNDVLKALVESAQNAQGMPNTIKFNAREAVISGILDGYDLKKVAAMDPSALLERIQSQFGSPESTNRQRLWKRWSRSIVESAQFLQQFEDLESFKAFVALFNDNSLARGSTLARAALPCLLAKCIHGIGFALACDFLKEIGYVGYPKPDTHMKHICTDLELASSDDDVEVFEALIDLADACGETPYKVDRILWLISSGNFYLDEDESGAPLRRGRQRGKFIEAAREALNQR